MATFSDKLGAVMGGVKDMAHGSIHIKVQQILLNKFQQLNIYDTLEYIVRNFNVGGYQQPSEHTFI